MVRLLLADDHEMFRDGLKRVLSAYAFDVIAEAANGREAVRLARRHQPDVAILDITMPELNGIDTAREVLRAAPRARVIVLTMHTEDAYLLEALRAGARGYVLKSLGIEALLEALRQVAAGEVYLSPGLSRALVESYAGGFERVKDPLTPREREVLQLIAEGKTTREIAATLTIGFKTAETHRQHIMTKLAIHDTAGLVRYAIRHHLIEP
jgi:two-component system response regulator NreC